MYGIDHVRQITPEVLASSSYLFQPRNPLMGLDSGVEVSYYLADGAEEVVFEFSDGEGNVLQTFTSGGEEEEEEEEGPSFRVEASRPSPSSRDGLNRFRWNLRLDGWTDFEGRIFWAAGNQGPSLPPGAYSVKLTVDGRTVGTRNFRVGIDPRVRGVTSADLQARFELSKQIRDAVTNANEAVIGIREVKAQIDDRLESSRDRALARAGQELKEALGAVESEIYQVRNESNQDPLNFPIKLNNKLAALMGGVEGSLNRPTNQSVQVFEYLSELLAAEFEKLHAILQEQVPEFNALLRSAGLDPLEIQGHGG
jgi:hypothetical protein